MYAHPAKKVDNVIPLFLMVCESQIQATGEAASPSQLRVKDV